ncbi:MAG: hypothetical protein EBU90_29195 [Proteobacteria bacterium]|nr:hypothetical protein [Pseudomonadota bacterium]
MRKKLLVFAPHPTDATSFYRAYGPLSVLTRQYDFDIQPGNEVNWSVFSFVDAIFLQRPWNANHLNIIKMAKSNNKKVWIDYDDDLFAVPFENRAYPLYSQKSVRETVVSMLGLVDFITVSTKALRERMVQVLTHCFGEKVNTDKVKVVPNAYNEMFAKDRREVKAQSKQLLWRGSNTHDKDLMLYTSALKQTYMKHMEDWQINFVGQPFWYTVEIMSSIPNLPKDKMLLTKALDPADYWRYLNKLNPALVFVPLWDCPFNKSKSNIAWIEGLHGGSACLAPDWEEWKRPGIINFKNQQDFATKLDAVLKGEVDTLKLYHEGWEYIQDVLTLKKVNEKRMEILQQMWD